MEDEDVLNSISHVGNKISICSICGQEQGKVGMKICNDIVEIEMEERFKQQITKGD